MRKQVIKIITVVMGLIISLFGIHNMTYAEEFSNYSNELLVDITNENGENILLKDDAILYIACPIRFTAMTDRRVSYSFSTDDGITFSDYVLMQDNSIVLYPDEKLSPNGNYILRFRADDLYSKDYHVQFDFTPPNISFLNEELLNKWLTHNEELNILLEDNVRVSHIVALLNGEMITDSYFDIENELYQNISIPLDVSSYENEGQNVTLKVYDEANNEAVISYNYFLKNEADGQENGAVNDNLPPEIVIEGIKDTEHITGPVNVMIKLNEALYDTCDVDIKVLRQRGKEETWLPIEKQKMQSPNEVRMLSLVNDGDYTISVSAVDANGMSSYKSANFRIDANAPLLKISGVSEGVATSAESVVRVNAKECFYDTTTLKSSLYKKEQNGELKLIDTYVDVMKSNQDYQDIKVSKEGDYELFATATDGSGNTKSEKIDFTVDYTPPVIGSLDEYDGKYLKEAFIKGTSLASLISDVTSYTYEAFINDNKITGDEKILEEGKYTLYLAASDKANNVAEKSATFIIDRTAPQITIRGMKADGYIRRGDKITVGLSDGEDELIEVRYNGKVMPIDRNENTSSFVAYEEGECDIEVKAIDKAQNETNKIIHTSSVAMAAPFSNIVKSEKMLTSNIVDSDKNDIDFRGAIIGGITMLAGTFGLVFRGIRAD